MADEIFNQADADRDQRLNLNEFRSLIAQNLGFGSGSAAGRSQSAGGFYGSSSTNLSGNVGAINGVSGANAEASYGSFDQSAYAATSSVDTGSFNGNTSSEFGVGGFDANGTSSLGVSGYEASGSSNLGLTTEGARFSSSSTFETSSSQQQLQVNASNPQNLYQDPNPQIIRRAAQGGQVTYTQHVKIRFLQPPPVPPPGPLIIKEVRPPQPPPPPPLRIRQQAPPPPQLPPLVLRERPPNPPASVASQTVVRKLPALPLPPRSVVIERLPALPPKPRDIIIERWIPYAAVAKRKTIVQRAEGAKEYPKPRNIIIQYEPVRVRVIRQFQRLGISQENPQIYIQRYGITLLDAQTLVQQARAAGVIEDISPPAITAGVSASSTSFNAEFNSSNSGIETAGGADFTAGGNGGVSASSFGSSSYTGGQQGSASFSGSESAQGASFGGGFSSSYTGGQQGNVSFSGSESAEGAGFGGDLSSSYESNSFASQGGNVAFGGAQSGGGNASGGYENYSGSFGGVNGDVNDPATAAFLAADLDKDGGLDAKEFRQFLSGQLQNQ